MGCGGSSEDAGVPIHVRQRSILHASPEGMSSRSTTRPRACAVWCACHWHPGCRQTPARPPDVRWSVPDTLLSWTCTSRMNRCGQACSNPVCVGNYLSGGRFTLTCCASAMQRALTEADPSAAGAVALSGAERFSARANHTAKLFVRDVWMGWAIVLLYACHDGVRPEGTSWPRVHEHPQAHQHRLLPRHTHALPLHAGNVCCAQPQPADEHSCDSNAVFIMGGYGGMRSSYVWLDDTFVLHTDRWMWWR
jgi:hypothetical protein